MQSYPKLDRAGANFVYFFACLASYCHCATKDSEHVEGTLVPSEAGAPGGHRQAVAFTKENRYGLYITRWLTACSETGAGSTLGIAGRRSNHMHRPLRSLDGYVHDTLLRCMRHIPAPTHAGRNALQPRLKATCAFQRRIIMRLWGVVNHPEHSHLQ